MPLLYSLVYDLKQKNVTERSGEDLSRSLKSILAKQNKGHLHHQEKKLRPFQRE